MPSLAPSDLVLPSGALGELHRRVLMHHGVIPPPPGTKQITRSWSIRLTGISINRLPPGSLRFDRAKLDLQGRLMQAQHELHDQLPRPIPSIGGPVFAHARLTSSKPALRDVDNHATLIIKAWGDALVGPKWRGQPTKGQKRIAANRTLLYNGRAYTGGWLEDDSPRHWLTFFDLDPKLGDPCLTLSLTWDQAL